MSRIAVIGGTGYAGGHIVQEAQTRGHTVLSVARTVPNERVPGVTYIEATLLDVPGLVTEIQGAEVVIVSVPARDDMAGLVRPAVAELVATLPAGTRIGVIGGAGGSLSEPEGPRVIDLPSFNDEYKPEAFEAIGILEDLQASDASVDWFYVHPAGGFGVWNPGERTGTYRDGGDVIVTDDDGESFISGPDLAVAILDEIESPKHSRERFTVGY